MVPRFEHPDCSGCYFLGSYLGADWYVCTIRPPSIIRRMSSRPADFDERPTIPRPKGGPWLRTLLLAERAGYVKR